MIRQARIADKDKLLSLWEEGYRNTPFSDMEYDKLHVQRLFANVCTFDHKFFCRVVDVDGDLHGVLIGVVDKNFWGIPAAQTLVSYANRDSDKLIRQFITWSKEKGAKMITVTTVPGKEKYETMIQKLGFKETGGLYTKEL